MPAQNQGTGSANVVQSNKPAIGVTNQPPKKFPIVLALGAVVLLLLFLVLAKYGRSKLVPQGELAAKVGSETITKDQVVQIATDCAISQEEAVYYLVDEKVLTKWATDEKVTVSDKQVDEEAVRIGGLNPKECKKNLAKVNLLRQRLSENLVKFREGKLIVINFGRYNLGPPYGQIKDPVEREKLRKEERANADQLLASILNDLKASKITFDEAMKKAEEDPRVGLKSWYSSTLQSGPFTAFDYINERGLLAHDEIREKIDLLKSDEFTEPIVQKIGVSLTDPNAGLVDERYVIAKVERLGKGFSGTKEGLLKQTREQYKAVIYE